MRKKFQKKKFKSIFMNRLHPEVGEWKGVIAHVANCNSGDPPILFEAKNIKTKAKRKNKLCIYLI